MLQRVNDLVGLRQRLLVLALATASSVSVPTLLGQPLHEPPATPTTPSRARKSMPVLTLSPEKPGRLTGAFFAASYHRLGRAAAAITGFIATHLVFVQTGWMTRRLYLPSPAIPNRRLASITTQVAGALGFVRQRTSSCAEQLLLTRAMQSISEAWCRGILFAPPGAEPLDKGYAYVLQQDIAGIHEAFVVGEGDHLGSVARGVHPLTAAKFLRPLQLHIASACSLDSGRLADQYVKARDEVRRLAHIGEDASSGHSPEAEPSLDD